MFACGGRVGEGSDDSDDFDRSPAEAAERPHKDHDGSRDDAIALLGTGRDEVVAALAASGYVHPRPYPHPHLIFWLLWRPAGTPVFIPNPRLLPHLLAAPRRHRGVRSCVNDHSPHYNRLLNVHETSDPCRPLPTHTDPSWQAPRGRRGRGFASGGPMSRYRPLNSPYLTAVALTAGAAIRGPRLPGTCRRGPSGTHLSRPYLGPI